LKVYVAIFAIGLHHIYPAASQASASVAGLSHPAEVYFDMALQKKKSVTP